MPHCSFSFLLINPHLASQRLIYSDEGRIFDVVTLSSIVKYLFGPALRDLMGFVAITSMSCLLQVHLSHLIMVFKISFDIKSQIFLANL